MVYRIRFRAEDAAEQEVVVEANSPNEAMVKFRHMHQAGDRAAADQITSVSRDDAQQLEEQAAEYLPDEAW